MKLKPKIKIKNRGLFIFVAFILVTIAMIPLALYKNNDAKIDGDIWTIRNEIDVYVTKHQKLPATLNDLTAHPKSSPDATAIDKLDQSKFVYTPKGEYTGAYKQMYNDGTSASKTLQTYRYEICVNYEHEQNPFSYMDHAPPLVDSDGYADLADPPTSGRNAGRYCYKLFAQGNESLGKA